MFSGIVDHEGIIKSIQTKGAVYHITVTCSFRGLKEGESIAVDGICLTVLNPKRGEFSFDISPETAGLTTAGLWKKHTRVNLERALKLSDRLGGHLVTGHVDQRAVITERKTFDSCIQMVIRGIPSKSMSGVLKKGSISINGVSLTINKCLRDGFDVMLIPHTLERTNLKSLRAGHAVNIEFDWMLKVLIREVRARKALWRDA
ncbi:MAG: riboflavin synthase [Deltaproteobacteria bacterium]|nr:riboflavin synthase [Deltaproteobacteria bacterium]